MDYDKIPEIAPIRRFRDFYNFIADFPREWDKVIQAIRLIKSELKRLQDEKEDA